MAKNIIKGFLAGFIIGIAGAMFIIAKAQGYNIIPALVFPVGLFLICTFSFNLYTGKVGFVFDKDKNIKILDLLIMLGSNFIGALLFGLIFTAIFNNNDLIRLTINAVIENKFPDLNIVNILLVLLKSTLCGLFVYIAVYLYNKADSFCGKVLAIWIPIFTFVYLGLDHSIANMFYMSALNNYSVMAFVYIIIAIIGNSIGAILLDITIKLINKESK